MTRPQALAALLAAALVAGCDGAAADGRVTVEGRVDLFLDVEQVELLEGFDGHRRLVAEQDPWFNQDRSEVSLPLPRNARLVWNLAGRGGRFVAGLTRRRAGPAGDDSPAEVVITAAQGGAAVAGVELRAAVPPLPADPGAHPDVQREGPATTLALDLPPGVEALEITIVSPGPLTGDAALVVLLSPRVEQPPVERVPADWPLRFEEAVRLTGVATGQPAGLVELAQTRLDPAASVPGAVWSEGPVSVPAAGADGAFRGASPRLALAVTGGATASIALPFVASDAVLRAELALDERLPPGARAVVVLALDGAEILRREVSTRHWEPLELALGTREAARGAGRELTIRVESLELPAAWVRRDVPDYGRGLFIPVQWQARTLRVGLADLRLARDVERPRRLATAARPSLVLIHAETLRAEVVGQRAGRHGDLVAPHLTALARAGQHHPLALAPSPWTVPSTATLFTGLLPGAHGASTHQRASLPDEVPTLAELARADGVVTAAVVTNDLLHPGAGWARGFSRYALARYANARQVTDLAIALLGQAAGCQQLLVLHPWDPHGPSLAPGAYRNLCVDPTLVARDQRAAETRATQALVAGTSLAPDDPDRQILEQRYRGEVAYLDAGIGALLRHLIDAGLEPSTAVIVTADHGEEFFEHGLWGHGSQLFDESTRVPLIVAEAGRWGAAYRAALAASDVSAMPGTGDHSPVPGHAGVVRTDGLFAEALTILGVPFDDAAVRPALRDARDSGHAYVETEKGLVRDGGEDADPMRRRLEALRTAGHLLLVSWPVDSETLADGSLPAPGRQLFDLVADPGALSPLPATGPVADALARLLDQERRWNDERRHEPLESAADLETLVRIGYAGSRPER